MNNFTAALRLELSKYTPHWTAVQSVQTAARVLDPRLALRAVAGPRPTKQSKVRKVHRPTNAKGCKAAGQAKATHGKGSVTHPIAIREGNGTTLEGPRPIPLHLMRETLHHCRGCDPDRLPRARLHANKQTTVYKQKHSHVSTEQNE